MTFVSTSTRQALPATPGLRWIFRRNDDVVVCDLCLTPDHRAYELRIQPPWNPAGTSSELFDDAFSAFERHGVIERILINEGWTLEAFEHQTFGTQDPSNALVCESTDGSKNSGMT